MKIPPNSRITTAGRSVTALPPRSLSELRKAFSSVIPLLCLAVISVTGVELRAAVGDGDAGWVHLAQGNGEQMLDSAYRDRMTSHMPTLGIMGVRQRVIIGDGPKNTGQTGTWTQTKEIAAYLRSKNVHFMFGLVDPDWVDGTKGTATHLANYKHHAKRAFIELAGELSHPQGKMFWFGNELNLGLDAYTPAQTIEYARVVWEARNEVDPTIKLLGMPMSQADNTWTQDYILGGATRYSDFMIFHAHGRQLDEGVGAFKLWTHMKTANTNSGYPIRPIWSNETGWNFEAYGHASNRNKEYKSLVDWWRWVQAKRFGISGVTLFAWQKAPAGVGWDYMDPITNEPLAFVYDAIKEAYRITDLNNGGFETAQLDTYSVSGAQGLFKNGWIVHFNPGGGGGSGVATPPEWGRARILTDGANERTGSGYLRLTSGGYNRVRRPVSTLTPGQQYTLTAWAKGSGDTAHLKALGFNTQDGLKEASQSVSVTGTYQKLEVTFTPSKYWVVVSLESSGNGTVYWDDVSITAVGGGLPSPWQNADVGAVPTAGSASHSSGTFTVNGSGDITGTADAFHYVYQTASGDCAVVARVVTQQDTGGLAKAGVMIRETLTAGSKHASVFAQPGGRIRFNRRTSTGGTSGTTINDGFPLPYWIKIVRAGNTFTGSRSPNGTTWTTIGSVDITMGTNVFIGLPVASTQNTLGTATFDNVTATP